MSELQPKLFPGSLINFCIEESSGVSCQSLNIESSTFCLPENRKRQKEGRCGNQSIFVLAGTLLIPSCLLTHFSILTLLYWPTTSLVPFGGFCQTYSGLWSQPSCMYQHAPLCFIFQIRTEIPCQLLPHSLHH